MGKDTRISDLVVQAGNGDSLAIETLYTEFYKDVYYTCYKTLGLHENAQDIAQDTFIEAFLRLDTLKEPASFKAWILKIAANKSIDFLKRSNRMKPEDSDTLDRLIDTKDFEISHEIKVIDEDVRNTLRGIIDKLPDEQRAALILYYYNEMTTKEIALAYGCPESTIKSRLQYARKFIKKEVERLEDNGYQLRCTAALPFLLFVFEAEKNAVSIPAAGSITSAMAAKGASAMTAGKAVGKAAGLTKTAKAVIAGIAATAIVSGGIITAVVLSSGKDSDNTKSQNTINSTNDISNVDIDNFIQNDDNRLDDDVNQKVSDEESHSKTNQEIKKEADEEENKETESADDLDVKELAYIMRQYVEGFVELSSYEQSENQPYDTRYLISCEWNGDSLGKSAEEVISYFNSSRFCISIDSMWFRKFKF